MRDYELTFIARPELDEAGLAAVEGKVKGFVTSSGGQIAQVEHWGRRQLAYPIKKVGEGQYIFMRVQLPAQAPRELERQLQLTEDVLRYLLVREEE
jgi:small subunit ribosomal protein S6